MRRDDVPADAADGALAAGTDRAPGGRPVDGLLGPAGIADHVGRQHGLKVSPGTVRLWVEAGRIPAVDDGAGGLFIDPEDVDRFFEG